MEKGKEEEKRRKPNTACSNCRKSHFRCVGGPPCDKCVKRGLKCEQPKKREERIQLLEETVKNLSIQLEKERVDVREKEISLRLTASWWKLWQELVNVEEYPLRAQSNSKASHCFRALLGFAREVILNPQSQGVLIPKMEELEAVVLGDKSQGIPFFIMKSITVYSCLCNTFQNTNNAELAEAYGSKLARVLSDYPEVLKELDTSLVSEANRLLGLAPAKIESKSKEIPRVEESVALEERNITRGAHLLSTQAAS